MRDLKCVSTMTIILSIDKRIVWITSELIVDYDNQN